MRLSPMVGIPKDGAAGDSLVQTVDRFSAKTISTYTGGDWSEKDVV